MMVIRTMLGPLHTSPDIRPRPFNGVKLLTLTAQFTLHPIFASLRASLPQSTHQIRQAEQVLDPEQGTPSRPIQERVYRRQTRPTQGEGLCSVISFDSVMNPVAVPGATHLNDLELLTKQGMKRMRNGELTRRFDCARCSWSIVPRSAA